MNTRNSSDPEHGSPKNTYQNHDTLFNELSEQEIHNAMRKRYSTAAKLARNAPQPHRGEMEKLFNISLYIHQRFEQTQQLPEQDINGAIAIFLYGIWSIYNQGATIPGKSFSNLIDNTHLLLENWGDFLEEYERSPKGKQQSLYETFSMVGNWLLMIQHHLTAQPDDTALNNIKLMVHEIITRSLKIEPEAIVINRDGQLTIAPSHTKEISA